MAVFCMPFTFTMTMLGHWIFSAPMCPIVLYMQTVSVTVSVCTIVAIGVDRYWVVHYPLRSRVTKSRSPAVIATIWTVACALSSVQLAVGRARPVGDFMIDDGFVVAGDGIDIGNDVDPYIGSDIDSGSAIGTAIGDTGGNGMDIGGVHGIYTSDRVGFRSGDRHADTVGTIGFYLPTISPWRLSSMSAPPKGQAQSPDAVLMDCTEIWPEPGGDTWRRAYTFFILATTYVLPLTILSLVYGLMSRKLWRREAPGNADGARDLQQLKSKRKVRAGGR